MTNIPRRRYRRKGNRNSFMPDLEGYEFVNAQHRALCEIVHRRMCEDGIELHGYIWAPGVPQSVWADALGFSERTLKRVISKYPIQRLVKGRGQDKVTYLRIGEPDPTAYLRDVRNVMSKIWRDEVQRPTTRAEFGCLCGLSECWPHEWQVKIFRHSLRHWSAFATCAKFEIEVAEDNKGCDLYTPDALANPLLQTARACADADLRARHYQFPTLAYLRRFHHVALDVYITDMQWGGHPHPVRMPEVVPCTS